METVDKDIIIRFKGGDMAAFECLVTFYEKAVYNYIFRMVRDTSQAKDITQDTFIKIYTHHKKIDTDKNIKSWIFTIATNTAYDFLRSSKARRSISLDENETFQTLATYSTTEGLITDVNDALDTLKLEYRNPIILYYKQGFDYKEIAEILSLPINTVKTHISRGKEQLKKLLKDYGEN